MMELPDKKIYIYSGQIDFRKGIASLNNLISVNFTDEDLSGSLFLFFSKNARQVKIIEIEEDGVWLYQKRLRDSRFVFHSADHTIRIDREKLKLILSSTQTIRRRSVK